jgi:hypothetical protein
MTANLAAFPDEFRPRAAALQGVEALSFNATSEDHTNWNFELRMATGSAEQASQTLQIANGLIAYARINGEQRPALAQFTANAKAKVENNTVCVTLSTEQKIVRKLIQRSRNKPEQLANPVNAKQ